MVGIAIFSTDPVLRRNLEQLPRDDPAVVIVAMVGQASSLRELDNRDGVDVLVADVPTQELLPNIAPDAIRYLWWLCSKERTARTPFARLTRARAPSSIARPAAMRLSQPSRQLTPGLSSWRHNSLRGCSMRLSLPMICSRRMAPGAPD